MNKKILGRATAISLAAFTSLSAVAMTASADLTVNSGTILNPVRTVSGSAVLLDYGVAKQTVTYTANFDATSNPLIPLLNIQTGKATPDLSLAVITSATQLRYDDNNSINVAKASLYFDKTTSATTYAKLIQTACNFTNTNDPNGQKAYDAWAQAWSDHRINLERYNNWLNAGSPLTGWLKVGDTTNTTSAYSDPAPAITFDKIVYTAETSQSSVSATALKDKIGSVIQIDNMGIISLGSVTNGYTVDTTSTGTNASTSTWYPTDGAYRVPATNNLSYLGNNYYYYTSATAANLYGDGYSGTTIASNYTSLADQSTLYFSAFDGRYYTSSSAAGAYGYVVKSTSTYSTTYGSYRASNGLYYPTISAAQNASFANNGTYTYTTVATTASDRYFSYRTGLYYSTATAAASVSGTAGYVDIANYTASDTYIDPYYLLGYGGLTNITTTIDPSDPTIYGMSRRSGWTRIASYISNRTSGSTVTIDMNDATTVPTTVLTAAKNKGVNLVVVLENGARWTLRASNINASSALNVATSYTTRNVPSSLIAKAKRVNTNVVSSAQVTIGTNGSLGMTADVTVKLAARRAGCTVKAYRYTTNGTLALADTSTASSTGAVTLTLKNGGSYILIIKSK